MSRQALTPINISYQKHNILTNPPPSSGGLLIAFALKLLEKNRNDWKENVIVSKLKLKKNERGEMDIRKGKQTVWKENRSIRK